jgi:hypothetical protein
MLCHSGLVAGAGKSGCAPATYVFFLQSSKVEQRVDHCDVHDRHCSRFLRAQGLRDLGDELFGSNDSVRETVRHHHEDPITDSEVSNIGTYILDDTRRLSTEVIAVYKSLRLKDVLK